MTWRLLAVGAMFSVAPVLALDGQPGLHDPSTVAVDHGRFYVYATGHGLPISTSDDGWTWRGAGTLMQAMAGGRPGPDVIARGGNNTWAPDVIHVGDKFFLYYAAPGTQPKAAIEATATDLLGEQAVFDRVVDVFEKLPVDLRIDMVRSIV
jgi:arabinan endo-1,5-alpha-L-arabinosidase